MTERAAPEAPSLADFYRNALEDIAEILRMDREDARLEALQAAEDALAAERFAGGEA